MKAAGRLRRLLRFGIPIFGAATLVLALGITVLPGNVGGPKGGEAGLALGADAAKATPTTNGSPEPSLPSPSVSPTPFPTITPIPATQLTATLIAQRKKYGIPGVEATIIWPDGRSWSSIAGYASLSKAVHVTRSTPFAVGSITKTFVAALVLQLAAEGKLDLDAPVYTGVTAAKVRPTVTIRQLLSHTSGVFDFFSNPMIDPALQDAKTRTWSAASDYHYVKTPYFEPGTGWRYSNTNYVLLGAIVQRVTGHTVAEELRTRFFGPLRLASALYQGVDRPRTAVAHAYTFKSASVTAKATDESDGTGIVPFTSVTTAAGPAGALAMSSWDLARWARALYGGRVLDPASLTMMTDTTMTEPFDPSIAYGLGFEQVTIDGRVAWGHGGSLIGTRAVIRYFPELGLSVAVAMNQWRSNPDSIVKALMAIAAPPPPPPPPPPSPEPSPTPSPTPTQFIIASPTPLPSPLAQP